MSRQIYSIKRIDAIQPSGANSAIPAFYVTPDQELFYLLDHYNGRIPIKIRNTNSGYDNLLSYASFQPSAFTGGFRPNFQEETGLGCILPEFPWKGYPPQLGEVEILYFEEDLDIPMESDEVKSPSPPLTNSKCTLKIYCKLLFIVLLVAIAIRLQ